MNCETATDLIIDSLMDELTPDQARQLEAHLASCQDCSARAKELDGLWSGLAEIPVPAGPSAETLVDFGRRLERRRPRMATSPVLRAAAVVALLLAGAVVGRMTGDRATDGTATLPIVAQGRQYLLLVRGDEPDRRFPETRLSSEYRDWAVELAQGGRLVAAEKLADDGGRWVADLAPSTDDRQASVVRGYFLITADSYEEAVAIARESPHIAYGGIMEVRAIERE